MTLAVVHRGRAVAVVGTSRNGTLQTYDPVATLPTTRAALARLAGFELAAFE